ncbi:MAG: PilN domain-containing protein [Oleiphilaceae bacterium]|nr:PilN domain-containing protein [Oleiphilaceae bacterium]
MPRINLRPWREELKAERQKQFVTMLVGVLIVAAGLVFLWNGHVDDQISHQNARNAYLKKSMAELDKKIKEIETLKKEREQLLSRMKVIQDLQGTRPVIVRVFDELVRTLPDGLYYESLSKKGDELRIRGKAESNNRISGLMRNFESSEWFANPNLTDVSTVKKSDEALNQFDMTVTQVTPVVSEDKQGAK